MTQDGLIRRDFVGIISAISEVSQGWEVTTQPRPSMQWGDKFDLHSSQIATRNNLKVGLQVCLILQRKNARKGKENSPHPWDYYEAIVGLKPVAEAQGFQPPPVPAPPPPDKERTTPGQTPPVPQPVGRPATDVFKGFVNWSELVVQAQMLAQTTADDSLTTEGGFVRAFRLICDEIREQATK